MATQASKPLATIGPADNNEHAQEYQMFRPKGIESVNSCVGVGGTSPTMLKRKNQKREETLAGVLCAWIVEHQIGISVNLALLLFLTHISFPRARRRTRTFFELSYYDSTTGKYTQGWDDLYLVSFGIVLFTGLRVAVMEYVMMPLAQIGGIEKKKARIRFAEQAWLLLYAAIIWSWGMTIMYNSDYWLNLRELWTHFPTRSMTASLKWYYLVQFAFWIQQIVVVNVEERRKDYSQMFIHHIFTCFLMFGSYGYYQTKVGNAILCLTDLVDIVLPAAKVLKYLGFQTACDAAFVVFIVSWIITRHILYLMICWSLYADNPIVMPYGCYDSISGTKISAGGGNQILKHLLQPFREPGGEVCYNKNIRLSFLGLLLALQGLILMWLAMILQVAWKFISGKAADDSRSDDEGESTEEDVQDKREALLQDHEHAVQRSNYQPTAAKRKEARPKEEEVGVEGLSFAKRRVSPVHSYRKSGSMTSGISIPGHSDRKELLGRIGCDKPTSSGS
ncbi:MAG: sphingosine N-acyltransferase lag1 [Bathelium mastoideum]|nr:MAG: sphingosine N-acyltransferase lag1 [Bathelium mastoideum]